MIVCLEGVVAVKISATYICPAKGLMRFEAPDPKLFENAMAIAKLLGFEKLYIPILESSLLCTPKSKVSFLDMLVRVLDRAAERGLAIWMIAPCQRLLGVVWPAPYLVTPAAARKGDDPVFLDGQIRFLKAYEWWQDPFTIERRVRWLRDLLSAVRSHPAISGWLLLNRELEWARPTFRAADFVLQSFRSEIKEEDEEVEIDLGVGWQELLNPRMAIDLAGEVDGLQVSGLGKETLERQRVVNPEEEITFAGFLGTVAEWLFNKPVEIEIGWGLRQEPENQETWLEAGRKIAALGFDGLNWLSLCDPMSNLHEEPPWVLYKGLEKASPLSSSFSPKEGIAWINEIGKVNPLGKAEAREFIDISREEYLADPELQFSRLWGRFKEEH